MTPLHLQGYNPMSSKWLQCLHQWISATFSAKVHCTNAISSFVTGSKMAWHVEELCPLIELALYHSNTTCKVAQQEIQNY